MSHFSIIQRKLEQFIKKYYTNELIKGSILFFSIGLLYFIITLLVEHFLWLQPTSRALLFWTFVLVEIALFSRFIAIPLAKLFRLQKGISFEEASKIIGNHFPQVSDKLLNVIQLNQNQRESELLLASIDQKSEELQPVPFKGAIQFGRNIKYLKYAAIPVGIIVLVTYFWDANLFSNSYERVVHYDTAYEPPAPFQFVVLNAELTAVENRNFVLQVKAEGDIVPENAMITFNNEVYYMEQTSPGRFEYIFAQPSENVDFRITSNKVTSKAYVLEVINTPSLLGFEMMLDYPAYTGKRDEVLKSTGNATLPEGTRVVWKVNAKNTDEVHLKTADSAYLFSLTNQVFSLEKGIYQKLDYAITTSNAKLQDFENLSFGLNVVKDGYPEISIASKQDSSNVETQYFLGQVSDDYGLTKLQMVYYPMGDEAGKTAIELPLNLTNFDQFAFVFPGSLELQEGVSYEYYFEIFDNDAIHQFKSTKSGFYSCRKLTKEELENRQLDQQEKNIDNLSKRLNDMKEQDKRLEEITKTQREKLELNWNDKQKLENFLERQKQQEEMMKNFSKEMKENLEQFQPERNEEDRFKEELENRLDENEKMLEENEKLLEELDRLQEKIDKEELSDKLEKLAKQNKNQEKNLEQLVELTKRYYVTKKAEKLAEELFKLGEEQEKLADAPKEENTKESQEKLNEKFEDFQKDMEELQKENQELKEPMELPQDEIGEKVVEKEQQEATDKLEENNQKGAEGNQKKAGKKMKEMSQQMQSEMMAGQMDSIDEDVEMLRQILDNLVVFSFEQEGLMNTFREIDYGSAAFGKKLNIQNDLKLNFQHIDDSLFALSLRQPLISLPINEALTNVTFQLDKSLERLAQNEIRAGIGSQQYTITGANELAILLSDLLGNMQSMAMSMAGAGQGKGKGQGQGQGFQLPDIIQKQQSLSGKMKDGVQGSEGEGNEGEKGENGKGQGEGEGKEGQGDGNAGEGSGGQGDQNGKNGKEGNKGADYNERLNGELFEIYKQQQDLRNQLQDRLSKEGLSGKGGKIIKEMEGIEQMLLEKGFNKSTLNRMLDLQYELLKLEEADFEQGKEKRREAMTNRRDYENKSRLTPEDVKKFFNQEEILNREVLPLQLNYKKEVQRYFNKEND